MIPRAIVVSLVATFGILASACGETTPTLSPTISTADATSEPAAAGSTPTLSSTACTAAAPTPIAVAPAPEAASGNFRLLISDEENAIGDFARLLVTFKGFEI